MSPFQTFTARLARSVSLSDPTKHLEFEVPGQSSLRLRRRPMAVIQDQQARRRRNHPRLLHRFPAGRGQPLRALPEPGAGRLHVEFSLRHERGRRNQLPGTVRRLHSAAALARHHFYRHRHRHRALPLHAALAAGRSSPTSGQAVLAAVRQPDRKGHLLPPRISKILPPVMRTSITCRPSAAAAPEWQGLARIRSGTPARDRPGPRRTCTPTSAAWTR